MTSEQRVIIVHKDGRTYSVTEAVFRDRYEADGFKIDHPEAPNDFIADVPVTQRARRKPGRKAR